MQQRQQATAVVVEHAEIEDIGARRIARVGERAGDDTDDILERRHLDRRQRPVVRAIGDHQPLAVRELLGVRDVADLVAVEVADDHLARVRERVVADELEVLAHRRRLVAIEQIEVIESDRRRDDIDIAVAVEIGAAHVLDRLDRRDTAAVRCRS